MLQTRYFAPVPLDRFVIMCVRLDRSFRHPHSPRLILLTEPSVFPIRFLQRLSHLLDLHTGAGELVTTCCGAGMAVRFSVSASSTCTS